MESPKSTEGYAEKKAADSDGRAPETGPVHAPPTEEDKAKAEALKESLHKKAEHAPKEPASVAESIKKDLKTAGAWSAGAAVGGPPAGVVAGGVGWLFHVPGARELTIVSAKGILWWGKVLMPIMVPLETAAFVIFAPPKIMEWAEKIVKGEAIKFGGDGKKSSGSSGGASASKH